MKLHLIREIINFIFFSCGRQMLKGVANVEMGEGHHPTANEMQRTRSGKVIKLFQEYIGI